jgi:hypothetical protein
MLRVALALVERLRSVIRPCLTNESIHRGSQGFLMILPKWTAQKAACVMIPLAEPPMCGETDQLLGDVQTTVRSELLSATM